MRAPVRPPRALSRRRTDTSTRACWQKAGADFTTLTARGSPRGGRVVTAACCCSCCCCCACCCCCCCAAAFAAEEEGDEGFEEVKGNGGIVVVAVEEVEGDGGGCGNVAAAARAAAAAVGVSDRGEGPSPGGGGVEAAAGVEEEEDEAPPSPPGGGAHGTAVARTTCPKVPLPSKSSITYARPLLDATSESPTRMMRSECSLSRPALEAGSGGVVRTFPKFGRWRSWWCWF